jgi:hypothetical protein
MPGASLRRLTVLLALAGCSAHGPGATDAGAQRDAGQSPVDASSSAADAGVAADAGPAADSGPGLECIPSERRVPWAAGRDIPSYPDRKTACNVGCDFTTHGDDSTDDSTIIQSCLGAVAVDGACLVKAGTYAIRQPIVLASRKVLRGEGPGKTILSNRHSGGIAVKLASPNGIASGTSLLPLAGGYTKESTTLTFAAAPTFATGTWLAVTEDPDPSIVNAVGVDGECTWCGGPWQKGAGAQFMAQIVEVTGISGSSVTFDRPLYFTFLPSLHPAALPLTNIVESAGVESLTVAEKATGAGQNQGLVHFYGCAGCWAKAVEVSGAFGEFVELQFSRGVVVRDGYFHDPQRADSGRGYGVHVMLWNSDHLIENNVMVKNRHSMAFEGGGSGVVVGYNYMLQDWESDSDPQWLGNDLITHGVHPYMNLVEGNVHQQFDLDDIWGSSSHMTYFRNNPTATGDYQVEATENLFSIIVDADNRWANLVGNVLGTATRHGATSYDAAVAGTVLACGNGYVGSATPVDAACPCALPESLYLSGRPGWFTTPYGTVAWPPIGPDVAGSVSKIPAQLCYENTAAKGQPFDAKACYGQ